MEMGREVHSPFSQKLFKGFLSSVIDGVTEGQGVTCRALATRVSQGSRSGETQEVSGERSSREKICTWR